MTAETAFGARPREDHREGSLQKVARGSDPDA